VKAFNITEAKAQLSAVIQKVEGGEEVIITRAGKPVARVVPYLPTRANRRLGLFENRIQLGEGFDEWPEDIARSLGMLDE
jgi:prevent-host-death family protein